MSLSQFLLLRRIKREKMFSKRDCNRNQLDAIKYFVSLKYIEAVTDSTDYRNATNLYKITPEGEAALSQRLRVALTTGLSIAAFTISGATLLLSIIGII